MNWSEIFSMKGYAFYIWGSYGMAFLVFAVEIALVRRRRALALKQVRLMRMAEGEE
jgi:heme exporter protein D